MKIKYKKIEKGVFEKVEEKTVDTIKLSDVIHTEKILIEKLKRVSDLRKELEKLK